MNILKLLFVTGAALLLSLPAIAGADSESKRKANASIWIGAYGSFSSWQVVDDDELILWASPSRPYLVKIWRPLSSLRFAHAIGVTNTVGRITRFDRVIVDGERLPIRSIEALDRETAKNLRRNR